MKERTTTTVAHRIDDDDDGLSYSSTEHDISAAHDDKLVTRSPNVAATPLLPDVNLTGPSGKLVDLFGLPDYFPMFKMH